MTSEMPNDPLSSAAAHAEMGVPQSGRSLAKRVVVRITRFFVEPQRAYNRGLVDAVELLRAEQRRLAEQVDDQAEEHGAAIEALRSALTELQLSLAERDTLAALTRAQAVDVAQAVQRMEARVAQLDAIGRRADA